MRPLLLALLLTAPLLAGCFSDEPTTTPDGAPVARTAEEAGAADGPAPSAPKGAYQVDAAPGAEEGPAVAYPVLVETNPAKPPVELDLSDVFEPGDCRGLNFGGAEDVLTQASRPRRYHDLSGHLAVGDVFQYEIVFTYESTDSAWGEIHPGFAFGNTIRAHEESTMESRGTVAVNWTGQGYRASEDDMAWVRVACWLGALGEAIPYTLTVKLTFADSAVPAEAPFLMRVPEGATRLFVRGVALDGARGVASHFRLFGPDDALVCECALSSMEPVAVVPIGQSGDHVLLVDHTDNGFVSVAFDVPSTDPLRPMESRWVRTPIVASDGGPVDQTLDVDLPQVPLFMGAMVLGPETPTPGAARETGITVTNGRGEPLRVAWANVLAMQPFGGDQGFWLGFGPGTWAHSVDHHAFAPGAHAVHVESDALRGQVVLMTREYAR